MNRSFTPISILSALAYLMIGEPTYSRELLRAGAARVEITPGAQALRPGDRIRDALFVRALVIGDGSTCAVLVSVDRAMIENDLMDAVAIPGTKDCPRAFPVISATHTHSGSTHGIEAGGEPATQRVARAVLAAVTRAMAAMQPAQVGFGTTEVHLNTNRDLFTDNKWMQGTNSQGASDKTVAILEVLDRDGRPIGAYINYAMHPISFYLSGVISADVPGEVSRHLERRLGPQSVVLFVQGASGDQNPLLSRALYALVNARGGSPPSASETFPMLPPWVVLSRERDPHARLNEAIRVPVLERDLPAYEAAIQDQGEVVAATGAVIAESVLQKMRYEIRSLADEAVIRWADASVQCPGRDRLDVKNPVREGSLPPYRDGNPVTIKQGVLRIGDIYIAAVNGEVYSEIGIRLKREAPVSRLMMTTLANGLADAGYIYSNSAAAHLTFQVIGSRLKPGCAEDRIVNTAIELISNVQTEERTHE